jgi:ABC-2 type transport system ATP-binding protein
MAQREIWIECRHLTKRFAGVDVVRDISFRHEGCGIMAVIGGSRSGKSTLLLLMAGLIHRTSGWIEIQGRNLSDPAIRGLVGSMAGEMAPYRGFTVIDTLDMHGELAGVTRAEIRQRIEYLDRAIELPPLGTRVARLSPDQRRRVLLAASLVADPPVLIWDEPANLADEEEVWRIEGLLRSLSADHLILLGTRSSQMASHVARRVVVLDKGQLVYDGPKIEFGALLPFRRVEVTFGQPVTPARVASVLPLAFRLTVVSNRVVQIRFLRSDPQAPLLLQHLLPVGQIVDFRDLPTDWDPPPSPPLVRPDSPSTARERGEPRTMG